MKKLVVLGIILLAGAIIFTIGYSLKAKYYFVHNVEDLKGRVVETDFQKLKELERKFCDTCQDPYGGSYNKTIKKCRDIVEERRGITQKYTDLNILNWICHTSGECDVGYTITKSKTSP